MLESRLDRIVPIAHFVVVVLLYPLQFQLLVLEEHDALGLAGLLGHDAVLDAADAIPLPVQVLPQLLLPQVVVLSLQVSVFLEDVPCKIHIARLQLVLSVEGVVLIEHAVAQVSTGNAEVVQPTQVLLLQFLSLVVQPLLLEILALGAPVSLEDHLLEVLFLLALDVFAVSLADIKHPLILTLSRLHASVELLLVPRPLEVKAHLDVVETPGNVIEGVLPFELAIRVYAQAAVVTIRGGLAISTPTLRPLMDC